MSLANHASADVSREAGHPSGEAVMPDTEEIVSGDVVLTLRRAVRGPGQPPYRGQLLPAGTIVVVYQEYGNRPHTLDRQGYATRDALVQQVVGTVHRIAERGRGSRVHLDTLTGLGQTRRRYEATGERDGGVSPSTFITYVVAELPNGDLYESYVNAGPAGFLPGFDAVWSGRMTMGPVSPGAVDATRRMIDAVRSPVDVPALASAALNAVLQRAPQFQSEEVETLIPPFVGGATLDDASPATEAPLSMTPQARYSGAQSRPDAPAPAPATSVQGEPVAARVTIGARGNTRRGDADRQDAPERQSAPDQTASLDVSGEQQARIADRGVVFDRKTDAASSPSEPWHARSSHETPVDAAFVPGRGTYANDPPAGVPAWLLLLVGFLSAGAGVALGIFLGGQAQRLTEAEEAVREPLNAPDESPPVTVRRRPAFADTEPDFDLGEEFWCPSNDAPGQTDYLDLDDLTFEDEPS
ncbi:MAG: hypothetical protein GVY25_05315 [Bacteroidetes bacterium]|nr:hypothetical protein [Bacteroidota bacterium]